MISMANATLIASVTGIGVSGVIGPWLNAWVTRRANRQQFAQQRAGIAREDLTALVDEAAELLASGATNLRLDAEARRKGLKPPAEVQEWTGKVFPLQQRLRLRVPANDPLVAGYERVREALLVVAEAADEGAATRAIESFEAERDRFLDAARQRLARPVPDSEHVGAPPSVEGQRAT
jgi:hypothetical protein